jgi:hypothetical protein
MKAVASHVESLGQPTAVVVNVRKLISRHLQDLITFIVQNALH